MSLDYIAYIKENISEKELYQFGVSLGGEIQKLSDTYSQCLISDDDEAIWLHYDQTYFLQELEYKDWNIMRSYNLIPKTSIIISIALNKRKERSRALAKKVSYEILRHFPITLLDFFFFLL